MSGRGARREIEIKLPLASAVEGRRLLRAAGFRVLRRRVYEHNLVFDTPEGGLRARGLLLRIRRVGRRTILTFKGPAARGKYKSRQETETIVRDHAALQGILVGLGFAPVFQYEKYRTEYRRDDGLGVAALDETPIGVYMELEGSPAWIDRSARLLGFSETSYITSTYGDLNSVYCRHKGISLRDLLFPPQASVRRIL
jgi:adenylate cyclase class 2